MIGREQDTLGIAQGVVNFLLTLKFVWDVYEDLEPAPGCCCFGLLPVLTVVTAPAVPVFAAYASFAYAYAYAYAFVLMLLYFLVLLTF